MSSYWNFLESRLLRNWWFLRGEWQVSCTHVKTWIGQSVIVVTPLALLQRVENQSALLRVRFVAIVPLLGILLLNELSCSGTVMCNSSIVLIPISITDVWCLSSLFKDWHACMSFALVILR